MYERPTKGDLDRNLSMIFHAAHHKARAECARLKSDFAVRGMSLKSTSLIGVVVGSVDTIHKEALPQAMRVVLDFAERMQVAPKTDRPLGAPASRATSETHCSRKSLRLVVQPSGSASQRNTVLFFSSVSTVRFGTLKLNSSEGRSLAATDSDCPRPLPAAV